MHLRNIAVLLFLFSSTLSAYRPIEAVLRLPQPTLTQLENAISRDYHPGVINGNQESYLHLAAKRNLGDHIELLMQVQAINNLFLLRNLEGQTAIEIAILRGKLSAFDALSGHLRDDDDIRVKNPQRWSLLHLAAYRDRAKMIAPLLATIPVNYEDERGWSALDVARLFQSRNAEWVLKSHGAVSTNAKDHAFVHFDKSTYDSYIEEEAPNPLPAVCEVMNPLRASGFWPNAYCESSSSDTWR